MLTVIRYTLRRSRGAIIGWGLGLAILAIMMGSLFDMVGSSVDLMDAYVEALPEFAEIFDIGGMNTPIGWLDVEYFSFVPLIISLFATGVGAGLLARDEERGTLDLILAHPAWPRWKPRPPIRFGCNPNTTKPRFQFDGVCGASEKG